MAHVSLRQLLRQAALTVALSLLLDLLLVVAAQSFPALQGVVLAGLIL